MANDMNKTPRTSYSSAGTYEDDDALSVGIFFTVVGMVATTILCAMIFIDPRAFTPDFVDRASADADLMHYSWLLLLSIAIPMATICLAMVSLKREWLLSASAFTMLTMISMAWSMACLLPNDREGRWNPYVRRMEPTTEQYGLLAEAKSLPPVAGQIRRAAADGRIDRGEAYDIINGSVHFKAEAEAMRRRSEQVRREVLSF